MTDVIVIATGGRDWTPPDPVLAAFRAVEDRARRTLRGPYRFGLVQGECPWRWVGVGDGKVLGSADQLAVRAAVALSWRVFESRPGVRGWPADWDHHGKAAGTLRNTEMVQFAQRVPGAKVCVGFPTPNSQGTWHCMREARRAGILVWRVHPDGTIDESPEIPER